MVGTENTSALHPNFRPAEADRYVKSLNIDPIREADMLWIAEEELLAIV